MPCSPTLVQYDTQQYTMFGADSDAISHHASSTDGALATHTCVIQLVHLIWMLALTSATPSGVSAIAPLHQRMLIDLHLRPIVTVVNLLPAMSMIRASMWMATPLVFCKLTTSNVLREMAAVCLAVSKPHRFKHKTSSVVQLCTNASVMLAWLRTAWRHDGGKIHARAATNFFSATNEIGCGAEFGALQFCRRWTFRN